jgi:hypothetical protein
VQAHPSCLSPASAHVSHLYTQSIWVDLLHFFGAGFMVRLLSGFSVFVISEKDTLLQICGPPLTLNKKV